MTDLRHRIPFDLAFYATPPHECSYLAERQAVTLFADPKAPMNMTIYSALAEAGFRRSGQYVYQPRCPNCDSCIPARIAWRDFRPNRSQKRVIKHNLDLTVHITPSGFNDEQFELYRRYMHTRHPDSGMDVGDADQYLSFLDSSWSRTEFVEFRLGERLLAVAVIDVMENGLSAVYTFFDPDESKRSLGALAILWQIGEAERRGLDYVYLGYYIEECDKMAYKRAYRPLEVFRNGNWVTYPSDSGLNSNS